MTTAEELKDKKAKTVADLIAKAESTTPEEAAALQERIGFLMAKYALDEARIQAAKAAGAQDAVVDERVLMTGSYAAPLQELMIQIAYALEIKPLVSGSGSKRGVRLVGFKSDVEQAKLLYTSLELQAVLALREFTRGGTCYSSWHSGMEKYKIRRDFVFGFSTTATARIRKGKEAALAEAREEDKAAGRAEDAGTDLVLVRKADKVQAYLDEKFGKLGTARGGVQRGYSNGYIGGMDAGRNANVSGGQQAGLAGTKKAIRG